MNKLEDFAWVINQRERTFVRGTKNEKFARLRTTRRIFSQNTRFGFYFSSILSFFSFFFIFPLRARLSAALVAGLASSLAAVCLSHLPRPFGG